MARDIMQPVGEQCANLPSDIMLMQELLNRVPDLLTGAPGSEKLRQDGQLSPAFINALNAYQMRTPAMQFEKKRVMPGGATMARLNSWDMYPPIHRTGMLLCPHGGAVQIIGNGKGDPAEPTLGLMAMMTVAGCAFSLPGVGPSPCVGVKWLSTPCQNFVDQRAIGICTSAAGVPQGNVMVVNTGVVYV